MTYSQGERLLLDRLLQIDVVLVGHVERQLQLGDLDLQLLLHALHLGLQLGLGLDYAGVQLLDLDAGLLANLFRFMRTHRNRDQFTVSVLSPCTVRSFQGRMEISRTTGD